MIVGGAFFAYWLGKDAGLILLSGQWRQASWLDRQPTLPPTIERKYAKEAERCRPSHPIRAAPRPTTRH